MAMKKKSIEELLKANNQGIKLDLGCGASKDKGFVGIDVLDLPEVDIVWDLEKFPWPLPDESVSFAKCSHLIEHISPARSDARLAGLVDLLLKKKVISQKEVAQFIGEYQPTSIFLRFMDELWRVMKPDAQFMLVTPYAGSSGYWWDPTHVNGCNEYTWEYFDPLAPMTQGAFYELYKPKPWRIVVNTWSANGNMEVVLSKRAFRKDGKYVNES